MEGEGSPSDEQTKDPTGQSRRDGGVEFGLEIDSSAVDAAVAVDRGEDGGAALVGSKGRVLDKEELGANLQGIVGSLAAMHPDGGAVGDLLRGGQAVVGDREANALHDVPQRRVVGGVQNNLVAGDGGARGAGYGIYRLPAVEEGKLVALDESGVVVDDGLRELRHSGSGADGESTEADAADEFVAAVHGHANARQGAACNLIRCEDSTAVELHRLGDVHLDDTEIGLDESVVNIHTCGQIFKSATQHSIELSVYGAEIRPLGTEIHLPCGAKRGCGLYGQLAHYCSRLGLAVKHLADFTADAGVYSKDFCHCLILSVFDVIHLLDVFSAWPYVHLWLGFERRCKSISGQKNEVWICPLFVLFRY